MILQISLFLIMIAIIVLLVVAIIYIRKFKNMNIESYKVGDSCVDDSNCNCKNGKCQPET